MMDFFFGVDDDCFDDVVFFYVVIGDCVFDGCDDCVVEVCVMMF